MLHGAARASSAREYFGQAAEHPRQRSPCRNQRSGRVSTLGARKLHTLTPPGRRLPFTSNKPSRDLNSATFPFFRPCHFGATNWPGVARRVAHHLQHGPTIQSAEASGWQPNRSGLDLKVKSHVVKRGQAPGRKESSVWNFGSTRPGACPRFATGQLVDRRQRGTGRVVIPGAAKNLL